MKNKLTLKEKKEIAFRIYEESIKDKTTLDIWLNSPNTFYRWAKGKIQTNQDVVTLINEEAPIVPWNIKIITPVLVEVPKKKGRPKKEQEDNTNE